MQCWYPSFRTGQLLGRFSSTTPILALYRPVTKPPALITPPTPPNRGMAGDQSTPPPLPAMPDQGIAYVTQ